MQGAAQTAAPLRRVRHHKMRHESGRGVCRQKNILRRIVVEPVAAIEAGERDAAPFDALVPAWPAVRNDAHHHAVGFENFSNVPQIHALRKPRDVLTVAAEGSEVTRAISWDHKEEYRGQRHNPKGKTHRRLGQSLFNGRPVLPRAGVRALGGTLGRLGGALDFITYKGGNRKKNIEREPVQVAGAHRQDGAGQHHHKGEGDQVGVIAVGARREYLDDGCKKHQVDRGRQHVVQEGRPLGENQEIKPVKENVKDGDP